MTPKTPVLEIFVDGACSGNPGPGGWGAILRYGDHEKELSGYENPTTNNRMELSAAIYALKSLKKSCPIVITTDSKYVQQGITEWLPNWKARGWLNAARQPIKNQDLWQMLDELSQAHSITWKWVKGHSGHIENERADVLAREAIEKQRGY